jgi:hypothetical protein
MSPLFIVALTSWNELQAARDVELAYGPMINDTVGTSSVEDILRAFFLLTPFFFFFFFVFWVIRPDLWCLCLLLSFVPFVS